MLRALSNGLARVLACVLVCVLVCVPWGLVACTTTTADTPAPAIGMRAADFDVEHYALDIVLDPQERRLQGTCRIRLWPTVASLRAVDLDLVALAVDRVTDRAGRNLSFAQRDGALRIDLVEPLLAGDYAELTVHYGGRPAKGLYFSGERAGVPTQVFTHAQCADARAWFPCFDEPHDRATSEIVVRVPRAWSVLSGGERLERREEGDQAVERWRTTFPHPPYLMSLVAGELTIEESQWEGVPLWFAAEPRLAPELAETFAETDEILAFLTAVTGVRYPYAKYSQAAVDGFPYGGMENMSATTVTDSAVTDAAGLADVPSTGLVAHEAAHQWFGDLVTCRDWSHAWLNEGFATYFAALYTDSARGNDAFLVEMDDARSRWLARDRGSNRRPMVHGAARDPLQLFFSGHAYEGGSVRLHHLRALLGDDAFFRGVRAYLAAHRGGSVVTDDLRVALEGASGRDLRAHFERWFHAPGHPRVAFAWSHDDARNELEVRVRQTQDDPPFPCLIECEIADAHGVRRARWELDGRRASYVLPQTGAPRWVRLDPACALPAEIEESRTFAEWIAILAHAPDAAGRRAAATFLAGHRATTTDSALRSTLQSALLLALSEDPSPAVRVAIARSIGPAHEPDERAAFVVRARADADPAVRAAALRALEPAGSDTELADLARVAIARGGSYAVVGAALGLLVRAEPGDAIGRLRAELEGPSPHGERAARVLAEVARLKDPRGVELLRAYARDDDMPDPPRRLAIAELGMVAATDPAVRAELCGLLDSPRSRIRRDAIRALERALVPEVRARLQEHARRTPHDEERRAIEKALAADA